MHCIPYMKLLLLAIQGACLKSSPGRIVFFNVTFCRTLVALDSHWSVLVLQGNTLHGLAKYDEAMEKYTRVSCSLSVQYHSVRLNLLH